MKKIDDTMMLHDWLGSSNILASNIEQIKIDLASDMVDLFRKNIEHSTYFGESWPILKQKTLERRKKRLAKFPPIGNGAPIGGGNKALLERGVLWGSIVYSNRKLLNSGFKTHIYLDPRKYNLEDNRHKYIYGGVHNKGIGKIPKRQFMPYNKDREDNRPDIKLALKIISNTVFSGLPGMVSGLPGVQGVVGSHY